MWVRFLLMMLGELRGVTVFKRVTYTFFYARQCFIARFQFRGILWRFNCIVAFLKDLTNIRIHQTG